MNNLNLKEVLDLVKVKYKVKQVGLITCIDFPLETLTEFTWDSDKTFEHQCQETQDMFNKLFLK